MRIAASPIDLNPSTKADPAKIDKVSRQLEGQFAQMLVKSMRDASSGDPMFPGENQMFREMYDQQMAKALTEGKGLGLSAMISKQLSGDVGGPALNTSLSTANAAKAYALVAGKRDASLPLPARDGAVGSVAAGTGTMGGLTAGSLGGVGMSQVLDLIAGRSGGSDAGSDDAAALSWPSANDRWADVAASDAADANAAVSASAASSAAASLGERTPEGFVAKIWTHAQKAARELGVDPRALVAQAALETGWGRRGIGNGGDSNNLFGIKASGWSGNKVTTGTHEYVNGVKTTETADFRAYGSAEESFADYVRLLKNNSRYQPALQAGTDIKGFARGLQQAGYATDPGYAAKIAAIANGPTIDRAVAAIGNATADLSNRYASTAEPAGLGTIRR
ncbi:flagellar assembly peptidoglycan hydrolase FlgJ [Xanthomonas vesicatoria]|uniref:flagellar assembly peptidoglycan hydrolase FlgJ n=1 Tax=Xanthomonas vesicatoria TaxID=56460 RepID=UPI001E49CC55|nr:flagellar assembly peptidoglycan hydrolase FlgJ [Xanthomonas vesicatoria]MCC8620333.1 flagellar assembly peptidoglycan hydrolase FlgJ [Xanthomonas vesicatoria]MCC8633376.1 flagellar assembly peptidoglycan hydrolase FlgJ [Xanthomonas vesicatoria]